VIRCLKCLSYSAAHYWLKGYSVSEEYVNDHGEFIREGIVRSWWQCAGCAFVWEERTWEAELVGPS